MGASLVKDRERVLERKTAPKSNGKMVELGTCLGPHGVRGGTRVKSFSRPPEGILSHKRLFLNLPNRQQWYLIREGQVVAGKPVIFFEGVVNRTESESLRGAKILVERGSLPPVGSQQYYWTDLIGLSVLNVEKKRLGHVSGFIETGDHDVMQVSGERERLIPFVLDVYVLGVDTDAREIMIDWHLDD